MLHQEKAVALKIEVGRRSFRRGLTVNRWAEKDNTRGGKMGWAGAAVDYLRVSASS
jgi:hypothetical protein